MMKISDEFSSNNQSTTQQQLHTNSLKFKNDDRWVTMIVYKNWIKEKTIKKITCNLSFQHYSILPLKTDFFLLTSEINV